MLLGVVSTRVGTHRIHDHRPRYRIENPSCQLEGSDTRALHNRTTLLGRHSRTALLGHHSSITHTLCKLGIRGLALFRLTLLLILIRFLSPSLSLSLSPS